MISDLRRAYFYAPARRDLYIELPADDVKGHKGLLGKLRLSLYGTRDAASNGQEVLTTPLPSLGFLRGTGYTCCYYNLGRSLWTMVHGDDYVSSGYQCDSQWLQHELESASEIKTQHIGPRSEGFSRGKVLNRIVRLVRGG